METPYRGFDKKPTNSRVSQRLGRDQFCPSNMRTRRLQLTGARARFGTERRDSSPGGGWRLVELLADGRRKLNLFQEGPGSSPPPMGPQLLAAKLSAQA